MDQGMRTFHVLVFPGHECYVAQFIECDIVTQAETWDGIKDAIRNIYAAHVDLASKEGRQPFEGLEPAPQEHREMFEKLRDARGGSPYEVIELQYEDVEKDESLAGTALMLSR